MAETLDGLKVRIHELEKEVERLKERINLVATIGVIRGYDDVN